MRDSKWTALTYKGQTVERREGESIWTGMLRASEKAKRVGNALISECVMRLLRWLFSPLSRLFDSAISKADELDSIDPDLRAW